MSQAVMMKARVETKNPYLVMMGLYLGAFVGMFSETSLNIALPQLMSIFQVSAAYAQWMVIGYMLVIGLVLPFASLLMKWFSVRHLCMFALGAFFVGALISGCANSFGLLLAGRMIQGIGTGLILPLMFSLVLEVFPPQKIGAAMGVASLIIMFAPAIGPTLSGIIIGAFSWRGIFFAFAIILFVALLFTVKYMVDPYELTKPHIDILSCVLSCIGFGALVVGVSLASAMGWLSTPVIGGIVVGLVCLAAYAKRQLSMKVPVLNVRVFNISAFRIGASLVMIDFGIILSAMYLFPQYIQNGMLLPVAMTGILMLPGGVINAIVSLISGKLYDKIGAKVPTRVGFLIAAVGAILLTRVGTDSSIGYVIFCHIVIMIGAPLAMSPAQSSGLNALPGEMATDGSTILNTMQQVLGAICTAVATSLLAIGQSAYTAAGGTDSAQAFVQGTHYGLYFTVILAVLGFVISLGVKNDKKH